MEASLTDDTDIGPIIEPEALDLIARHMRTPPRFAEYLNRSPEGGHLIGRKPVTAEIAQSVLTPDFNGLEPRLTRQGYSVKSLSEQFRTRPAETHRFLNGQLEPSRTREIADRMRVAGISI